MVQTVTSIHVSPGGLVPGGTVVLTTKETSRGKQVGTSQVACVVIQGTMAECEATTFTSKGQIEGQGPFDISKPFGRVAIVGGTGAYKTARGRCSSAVRRTTARDPPTAKRGRRAGRLDERRTGSLAPSGARA